MTAPLSQSDRPKCPRHKDGKHKWQPQTHIDGCHFYAWSYSCSCGATASTQSERDPSRDPYSLIWMDDEGQEEEERCQRCDELRHGAPTKHTITIIAKDGTVERDETNEHKQEAAAP